MRNKFLKNTFQKIHDKTKRMQFEFLKSNIRAKTYERLKFGKIGQNLSIRNSGFQPELRF